MDPVRFLDLAKRGWDVVWGGLALSLIFIPAAPFALIGWLEERQVARAKRYAAFQFWMENMARSKYIYLVRLKATDEVLASFTVKHEADRWAVRYSGHLLDDLQLSHIRDGLHDNKTEEVIPFTGQRIA